MDHVISERERTTSVILVTLILFVETVEYGLILPTLWQYLNSLGVDSTLYFGAVLSSYSTTSFLMTPIWGYFSDKWSIKGVIIITLIINIIGNGVYFTARHGWMILFARLLCGAGNCVGVSMTYVGKVYEKDRLTSVISIVNAVGELGLLFGPCFNIGLVYVDFEVGGFEVDALNVPGLVLAFLLLVCLVLVVALFKDVKIKKKKKKKKKGEKEQGKNVQTEGETQPLFWKEEEVVIGEEEEKKQEEEEEEEEEESWLMSELRDYREVFRPNTSILMVANFLLIFVQITLETILMPLCQSMYGWEELKSSLLYFSLGVIIFLGFLFLFFITSRFPNKDPQLMLIGFSLQIIPLTVGAVILSGDLNNVYLSLIPFLAMVYFIAVGLPVVAISVPSLFTKLTPPDILGRAQGVMASSTSLAAIISPLWAGWMLSVSTRYLFVVLSSLMISVFVAVFIFWKVLKLFEIEVEEDVSEEGDEEGKKGEEEGKKGEEEGGGEDV